MEKGGRSEDSNCFKLSADRLSRARGARTAPGGMGFAAQVVVMGKEEDGKRVGRSRAAASRHIQQRQPLHFVFLAAERGVACAKLLAAAASRASTWANAAC